VSGYFGRAKVLLTGPDLNRLIARYAPGQRMRFEGGCFLVGVSLPMGLGVQFVVVPQSGNDLVRFLIPFEQVRGDKTGGLVKMFAGSVWSLLRGFIEKQVQKALAEQRMEPDTIVLQKDQAGGKAGVAVLNLAKLNHWLLYQRMPEGLRIGVAGLRFEETAVEAELDIVQV